MRKNILSLVAVAMLSMASCTEDFEVAAPYKDVTVVYGIWDKDDTAHYVRIQKAFLDEKKSALDMAKVSDSSYYKDLTVFVREITGTQSVGKMIPLTKVDLAAEGYQKDAPANEQGFFTNPHNGYKLKTTLDASKHYRLVIVNNATGNTDSSEIPIVDSVRTNSFPIANFEVQFARTISKFFINIQATRNAKYYEAVMRFNYFDINVVDNSYELKHADLNLGRMVSNGDVARIEILNSAIYTFLAENLGVAPTNIKRQFDNVDFLLYAGSNELYQYEQVANAQGGITNDQIRPIFTNIKGKNTVGLLASRSHSKYGSYKIGAATIDSLIKNPQTSPINIIKP